nr:sugar MFS transporter [Sphingosinicella flava]
MAPASAGTHAAAPGDNAPADLRIFVFVLFFVFGGITSLNDVLIPKLKDLFVLSDFEAMLIQSAFFSAYFLISIPAAGLVRKFGYMRTAMIGLLTMTAGCLFFIPAASSGLFVTFLAALFVLAAGITVVQVVANPLISLLGKPQTAHSRLTFAQAFNSLGTTIFPIVGSSLILGALATVDPSALSGDALTAYRADEARVVTQTYIGLAVALAIVAGAVWLRRDRLAEEKNPPRSLFGAFDLLKRPRFAFGTLGIFLYVGAEVAIGSYIVLYLTQSDVLGIDQVSAGHLVGLYWGGAMVGRFVGSAILRVFSPGKVLTTYALINVLLLLVSANTTGTVAGYSLLAIGLFNSIMFPTIFSLASEGLGSRAAEGSGLLATAIVGGAIVPPLAGLVSDASSIRFAFIVPAICYLGIAAFGYYARRPHTDVDMAEVPLQV